MNKFFYILLCLSILPCSGCSGIGSIKFLAPQGTDIKEYVFQEDWIVDTYPDDSFGQTRPYLYKSKFNEELDYTIYPITIEERLWFFGPLLLPIIPAWYMRQPPEYYKPDEVKIIWFGDEKMAKEIRVTVKTMNKEFYAKSTIISSELNKVVCAYAFKRKFVEGDILCISLVAPPNNIELKLNDIEHTCFVPGSNPITGHSGPYAKKRRMEYYQSEISNMNASLIKQRENEKTKANHADSPNGGSP